MNAIAPLGSLSYKASSPRRHDVERVEAAKPRRPRPRWSSEISSLTVHRHVRALYADGATISAGDAARLRCGPDVHSFTRLSRSALVTTLTDDNAIAAAAIIGESRMPNTG